MPELNKERIFNESPKKVLIREYENLKKDYSKYNAIKYFSLYENADLSFILENSRIIFSEPFKGYEFYKNIVEKSAIPFDKIEDEKTKVENYLYENQENMSDTQKQMYSILLESVSELATRYENSINLYNGIMENKEAALPIYDALYRYERTGKEEDFKIVASLVSESDNNLDIMNVVHVIPRISSLSSDLYKYMKESYIEEATSIEDYKLNSFTYNVLSRMIKDRNIMEAVSSISNMNARHLILGLAGADSNDMLESVTTEVIKNYDPHYSTSYNAVNRIFEDDIYAEANEEYNDECKLEKLKIEKSILEMDMSFMNIDRLTTDTCHRNSIVERLCVESSTIEKIPMTTEGQIALLQERLEEVNRNISTIEEKYFTTNGSASQVVAGEVGDLASDNHAYKPVRHVDNEDYSDDNQTDDEDETVTEKEVYDKVEKPEKKNVFQRIQNKALDTNVQFKKKVAEGRRTAVDAKNAGKAVAKIPMNVFDSVKKQVDEWDEMDDNRRKEYIVKPGIRKKYFRALKLCIMHYGAFSINPVLNIVLAICHSFSTTKDIRIRNELARELKAEIKVTEEKIEDARGRGDTNQKYKLMRIKEKLDAELVRVTANSKFI